MGSFGSFGKLNYVDVIIDGKEALLPDIDDNKLIDRYNKILGILDQNSELGLHYEKRCIKNKSKKTLNLKLRTYDGDSTGFSLTQNDVEEACVLVVDIPNKEYYFIPKDTDLRNESGKISVSKLKKCGIKPIAPNELLTRLKKLSEEAE